jgi:hypothetical protein
MWRTATLAFLGLSIGLVLSPSQPPDGPTEAIEFSEESPAIRLAQSKLIDVDFEKTPLNQAMAFLARQTGINIILDARSLANAMVDKDQPVSLHLKRVRLTTAFELLLDDLHLMADFGPDVVMIVDRESTRRFNALKIHPIADLILNPNGGWIDPDGRRLAQVIQDAVDRDVWEPNGGDATISFVIQGIAFHINAPKDTHLKVKHVLDTVRRSRDQTARLLQRADIGALEQSLVESDRNSVSPIGMFAPEEYPPAAQIHSLIARCVQLSETAGSAYSLAQRHDGELAKLRKEVDELNELCKQLKPAPAPVSTLGPDRIPRPAPSKKQRKGESSNDSDF